MGSQENRCKVCAKKSHRACPALAGPICATCCGRKRGSLIHCPPDCRYFPLGTEAYDAMLQVENSCVQQMVHYAAQHLDQRILREKARSLGANEAASDEMTAMAFVIAVHQALVYVRDDSGKTAMDLWEEGGWEGLNNDERVLMHHHRQSFPTLVEIQEIVDDRAMRCADLLDPEASSFLLYDRAMTKALRSSEVLFMWLTRYPLFGRGLALATQVPRELVEGLVKRVRELTAKEFGEVTLDAIHRHLALSYADYLGWIAQKEEKRDPTDASSQVQDHGATQDISPGATPDVPHPSDASPMP